MLLQEAVEFVDRLTDISSASEINAGLRSILRLWGIDHFCFVTFPRPGDNQRDIVLTEFVPQVWLDRYNDQNYLAIDPGVKFTRQTFSPFRVVDAPDPEQKGRQIIHDLIDLRMDNAMMFPVAGSSVTKGIVWIQGWDMDLKSYPFLHAVLLYTYERLMQLRGEPSPSRLTEREAEVLKWCAVGKSAWEAGEILRISQKTVEAHIASAVRKLNAGNRTHAVTIALRNGFIAF
jgi:LuxR family transcriptional regulator, quorum-sensing system regulator BjaR1